MRNRSTVEEKKKNLRSKHPIIRTDASRLSDFTSKLSVSESGKRVTGSPVDLGPPSAFSPRRKGGDEKIGSKTSSSEPLCSRTIYIVSYAHFRRPVRTPAALSRVRKSSHGSSRSTRHEGKYKSLPTLKIEKKTR